MAIQPDRSRYSLIGRDLRALYGGRDKARRWGDEADLHALPGYSGDSTYTVNRQHEHVRLFDTTTNMNEKEHNGLPAGRSSGFACQRSALLVARRHVSLHRRCLLPPNSLP